MTSVSHWTDDALRDYSRGCVVLVKGQARWGLLLTPRQKQGRMDLGQPGLTQGRYFSVPIPRSGAVYTTMGQVAMWRGYTKCLCELVWGQVLGPVPPFHGDRVDAVLGWPELSQSHSCVTVGGPWRRLSLSHVRHVWLDGREWGKERFLPPVCDSSWAARREVA